MPRIGTALACSSQVFANKRLSREWKTVRAMVVIYCKGRHRSAPGLCVKCQELVDYAQVRLQRCVFGADKPTCANCPVHCYLPARRTEMKDVMRYAGPRMLWKHPVLCVRHWLDGLTGTPGKP